MLTTLALAFAVAELPNVTPIRFTESTHFDADDPAIWVSGESAFIVGTDKQPKTGALYVFDLKGKTVCKSEEIDQPNNVDILPGFRVGSQVQNLIVASERGASRLRCFLLDVSKAPKLVDVTGTTSVFAGRTGDDAAPMGIACGFWHEQPVAFVTPKGGPRFRHLQKLRLVWNDSTAKVDALHQEFFGPFSGKDETESVYFDSASRTLFYSDEGHGVWRMDENGSFSLIRNPDQQGDHEGLAAIDGDWIVNSDQRKGQNVYWLYHRASGVRRGGFTAPVDDTDGLDVYSGALGEEFPGGLMVAMNSKGKNFALIDLRDVRKAIGLPGKPAR